MEGQNCTLRAKINKALGIDGIPNIAFKAAMKVTLSFLEKFLMPVSRRVFSIGYGKAETGFNSER